MHNSFVKHILWNFGPSPEVMDAYATYTSCAQALYIIRASPGSFASEMGQDGQSLLFGENTVQVYFFNFFFFNF